MKKKFGFIGVGNLGAHLATNLLRAGFAVVVHDLDTGVDKCLFKKGRHGKGIKRDSRRQLSFVYAVGCVLYVLVVRRIRYYGYALRGGGLRQLFENTADNPFAVALPAAEPMGDHPGRAGTAELVLCLN